MIASSLPIWAVDVLGAIGMIVLSFMCMRVVIRLRRREPGNIIWTYLFWVCTALTVFAVSRSAGHILKQLFIITGDIAAWNRIRPYSGAINSFTFVVVGAFTLFFERTWNIYRQINRERRDLQETRDKLLYLNQNLENLVQSRTAELAESEHKYRRIFEVSRDMILVTDKNGKIVDINPAGCEMLGIEKTAARLMGYSFPKFIFDLRQWDAVLENVHANGFISNAEIDLRSPDNLRIRTLLSASLDRRSQDKAETLHLLVKNIEQKRIAEEQIAQADKLASIGQLSAGIAHEINNPLGIILGYTQLLLRQADAGSETHQDLKTIEKHVRNCKTIVEDLLNFARTSEPKKTLIRVDEVLEDVLHFMQQHADLSRIEVHRSYDAATPEMLLDEKKIKQVFMNLIMNAAHAMGGDGRLSVSTRYRAVDRHVVIRLSDTGHGIEIQTLPRIFDPFFTTKPTGEGTGLGLSVSYGIIKNHGGDIAVDSEAGHGATFTISLPVTLPKKETKNEEIHTDRR